jgi:hypothetical protein
MLGALYDALTQFITPQGCDMLRYIEVVGRRLQSKRKSPYNIQSWYGMSNCFNWRLRVCNSETIKYGLPGRLAASFDVSMYGKINTTPYYIVDWYLALRDYGWFEQSRESIVGDNDCVTIMKPLNNPIEWIYPSNSNEND